MEETKMSEDDSNNDLESEDNDDTSSECVDEEIELSQNFINTLAKIANDSKNYDDYILLVSINLLLFND